MANDKITPFPVKHPAPGQQIPIQIDLKNATPKLCECGCQFFFQASLAFTVSALVSPTGQELFVQQPVLVCMECKKALK